jgi:hypothetical protein
LPSSFSAKSCSSFTATWSIALKPPTCHSCLQLVHQAKSCHDLLHLSHMTQCHVSCNELHHHMCEPCNISKPFHLHGIGCSHMMYLWTNHLCFSHLNTLVHLDCHSITKTKLGTFHQCIGHRLEPISTCASALHGV